MAGSCGNDHPQVLVLKEPLPFSDEDVTFRLLSLNVCCTLASLAVGLSVFHIMQHALHCLRSWEQKHIIRILAVIPVYAWTTFFSYLFFGGLTTVVNYLVYLPCHNLLGISAGVSNMIAWVFAVAFAFAWFNKIMAEME